MRSVRFSPILFHVVIWFFYPHCARIIVVIRAVDWFTNVLFLSSAAKIICFVTNGHCYSHLEKRKSI